MNVILVSQCDKRALTETRRILDQFAERRGDRTWQTPITHDGLDTLRRLLRKTARKNTAVACHWVRGLDHSELVWVVGDRSRFNAQGAVPTNTTTRNVLREQDQNNWHTGEDIHLLTALAALLHDLGKATQAFQSRLMGALTERNNYRHEWVSLRLFEAFVGLDDDATWLQRLAQVEPTADADWLQRLHCDGLGPPSPTPFKQMERAPLAQAIGWLVLTHHRLPVMPCAADSHEGQARWLGSKTPSASATDLQDVLSRVDAGWNETPHSQYRRDIEPYWHFPHGLPVHTPHWHKQASRVAQRLLKLIARPDRAGPQAWLGNPFVMHLSRLALMLADHHYSSLQGKAPDRVDVPKGYPLLANTKPDRSPNQTLDEHLIGVATLSREITHALPRFDEHLPHLGKCPALRKRASHERYRWQDKAWELAATLRQRSAAQGGFIVNMASTGCGKTLANARIMNALADPELGMRCAFAMGLRTLTLQTGRAFRSLLNVRDDELAIRVGGRASRELFDHHQRQAERSGSASQQALMDEDADVEFIEGNIDGHPLLRRLQHEPTALKLLAAPLLVCTIDHLTPATESQRGGRQIAPMLRLMSGDLVLDEPDDFDLADLPALTRLVHWAGLLGARVLLSSATLPPSLIQGLFAAYANGRQHFQRNRGTRPGTGDAAPAVVCLWVDEFAQSQADCATASGFEQAHLAFAKRRSQHLAEQLNTLTRRRARLVPLKLTPGMSPEQRCAELARVVLHSAGHLHHQHHSTDPVSHKRVSFGLVRMANIEPLVEVALALYRLGAPAGRRVHLCVYHSQVPLLVRSAIEQQLDAALQRSQPEAVFHLPAIRSQIDGSPESDHLFIVLGSPVTEVGRDHDYDWAVVEPSSMRSIIQLAGRVKRHRAEPCVEPNIHLLNVNLRSHKGLGAAAFSRPGFELATGEFHLARHDLQSLLAPHEYERIDAQPRTVPRPTRELRPTASLVDLEHARTSDQMLPRFKANDPNNATLNAASWWHLPAKDALLTGYLPQQQPFRDDSGPPEAQLLLRPNEEGDADELVMVEPSYQRRREVLFTPVEDSMHHRIPDEAVQGTRIAPWGVTHYMTELLRLAEELGLSPEVCALRYGQATVPANDNGWQFHPALGFTKRK